VSSPAASIAGAGPGPEPARKEIRRGEGHHGAGLTPFSGVGAGEYIQHSISLPFIKNVFRFYDRERALFINSQDFFADPVGAARTAYRFRPLHRELYD